ncbi:MAG: SUMF1/EgtB/PvdO family nonheme iron enzyme [Acidobacteria bacterium]|nr:SUMF1/EgtB/PvdO family nonheme iron enzyme [Acidobacteriota bacterium]
MRDRYTRYPRPILWLIPGGEAWIGESEPDALPASLVEVEPFYLSKFPVTNEQFEAFDPAFQRSELSPRDTDPAMGLSWTEADEYCRWYAEVSRKPMRLPSEVEWEYACRAGGHGRFFFGDDPKEADLYLWDASNSEGRVQPADRKRANGFGLFGMLGGVWEWTASAYGSPAGGTVERAETDEERVLRGGSFCTPREEVACSLRRGAPADRAVADAGFRIARSFH